MGEDYQSQRLAGGAQRGMVKFHLVRHVWSADASGRRAELRNHPFTKLSALLKIKDQSRSIIPTPVASTAAIPMKMSGSVIRLPVAVVVGEVLGWVNGDCMGISARD